MRSKTQYPLNLKLIACGCILAFVLLFALRPKFSSQQTPSSISQTQSSLASNPTGIVEAASCPPSTQTCTKIPPSIVQAIIHYSTSSITPQQTLSEISVTSQVLQKKSPCNFLVFGLGHDSLMWASLNHGGRTVFLEEDKSWIEQIRYGFPTLESYHVVYDSKVHQADELMKIGKGEECRVVTDPRSSKCQLALKTIPNEVYEIEWDLIMVDAPTGFHENAPDG
ncbi:hypothetical protein IFM89_037053 [Coptis chinensis]|uniref:Polysaccharide biosynthesis domain-containing protein n=1 Tax=Coptis chinensis TaxID=261450 RepID=A0A835HQC8_9MAGN|nr:hypothetical protein IFM89_037053 [Coptis chinensis]